MPLRSLPPNACTFSPAPMVNTFFAEPGELTVVELLRSCPEAVALEGGDDRGQPGDLCVRLGTGGLQHDHLLLQERISFHRPLEQAQNSPEIEPVFT